MSNAGSSKLYHFVKLADIVGEHIAHILQRSVSWLTDALPEGTNILVGVIESRSRGFRRAEGPISVCYLVNDREKIDMYGRGM
jgi:hypothetical protein